MSEFASYCIFVRNKHSKQADWKEDLLGAAQAHPELAGAAVGGLGGAATGLFSGHAIRNGLIGAGLGAGAGFGYRMMGNKGPKAPVGESPLAAEYNKPVPTTSGVALPEKADGKSLKDTVGPLKQLGLPVANGDSKPPTAEQVNSNQTDAANAAKKLPEAPATAADNIRELNTKTPGNPLTTLLGGKATPDSELSKDSPIGSVAVVPTQKEHGVAVMQNRNHVTNKALEVVSKMDQNNPKVKQVKALIDRRLPAIRPDVQSEEEIRKAEGLVSAVDRAKNLPGELASRAGKKLENAGEGLGKGWDTVKDYAGTPGRMLSEWGNSWKADQEAEKAKELEQNAELDKLIQTLQQNQ